MGRYTITTEGEEALVVATAETILLGAGAASAKGLLGGFGVSLDGTSSAAEPRARQSSPATRAMRLARTNPQQAVPDDEQRKHHEQRGEPTDEVRS